MAGHARGPTDVTLPQPPPSALFFGGNHTVDQAKTRPAPKPADSRLMARMLSNGPRNVVVIAAAVVSIFVATMVVVTLTSADDPVDVVWQFLDAAQDGDTETVYQLGTDLALPRYEPPMDILREDEAYRFFDEAAVSDNWEVESITESGRSGRPGERVATVEVTVSVPDGESSGSYVLDENGDSWVLRNPFASVDFTPTPLTYVKANDLVVPNVATGVLEYPLMPGFYEFFRDLPGVEQPTGNSLFAWPAEADTAVQLPAPSQPLRASTETVEAAQRELDDQTDTCVAAAHPQASQCPFFEAKLLLTADGGMYSAPTSLTWELVRRPRISLLADSDAGFAVSASKPGLVALSGSGRRDGHSVEFALECQMELSHHRVLLKPDGHVRIDIVNASDSELSCTEQS
jgi:hypothetical protein